VTFSAPSSNGGKPITEYTVTVKGPNGRILTQSFPAQAGRVSVGQLNNSGIYTFTVRAVNSVGTMCHVPSVEAARAHRVSSRR